MEYTLAATISPEWKPINSTIKLNDICILASLEQEFFCVYKVPYEQFEYLYLNSFDFKEAVFAIQTKVDNQNYIRVLDQRPEKIFALRLYKKARQNEYQ